MLLPLHAHDTEVNRSPNTVKPRHYSTGLIVNDTCRLGADIVHPVIHHAVLITNQAIRTINRDWTVFYLREIKDMQ